jgi:hypothetical protein
VPKIFPQDFPLRVTVPVVFGAKTYSLVFPRGTITSPQGGPVDPADPSFFEPQNAVVLYNEPLDIINVGAPCGTCQFSVDTCTSRCSIWVNRLFQPEIGPALAAPPQIHIMVRQSLYCIPVVRFVGTYTPPSFEEARGLLVQISGILGDQWELFARIQHNGVTDEPPLKWTISMAIDDVGTINQALRGPFTAGVLSPP